MFLNFTEEAEKSRPAQWTGPYVVLWYDYSGLTGTPWRARVLPEVTLSYLDGQYRGTHRIAHMIQYRTFSMELVGKFGSAGQPFPLSEPGWVAGRYVERCYFSHYDLSAEAKPLLQLGQVRPESPEFKAQESLIRSVVNCDAFFFKGLQVEQFLARYRATADAEMGDSYHLFTTSHMREAARLSLLKR